jgi:hypothetical protein
METSLLGRKKRQLKSGMMWCLWEIMMASWNLRKLNNLNQTSMIWQTLMKLLVQTVRQPNMKPGWQSTMHPLKNVSISFTSTPPLSLLHNQKTVSNVSGAFHNSTRVCAHHLISMLRLKGPRCSQSKMTLVQCNNMIFLAVIKVLDIHIGSAGAQILLARLVHEPNA